MPLDPDLEGFLELAQMGRLTGKSQPMHTLSVEQARREFEQTSAILDPSPPGSVAVTELTVTARDGHVLPARLYRAPGTAQLPAIVYIHGGGYVVGSLDSHDSICRRLAASGQYAVFAPAYRLAPEAGFPTAVNDTLDAANWLAEQAGNLQLDSRRITVAGDSVGATLATVLAITAVKTPQQLAFKPWAQLLFYPVTDTSRQRNSHRQYAEDYLLETATLEWFYQHYCPHVQQRLDWRVSPLLAGGLTALAPAYISLAQYDPLYDEGQAYAHLLEASGTAVTLQVQSGLTHDFLRMNGITSAVAGIYAEVLSWLEEQR
ncbi:alpha/beta hydrolase [Pseudomonas synxantha]|uniref:Lipase n=1 Tax=Pseudomonas libanensis TaxID=75588 RepID=A0ABR5M0Y6_9PSED|nr:MULTISPECIES: alpha/beta hydrolase [Pseudomonas fluorescens group]KPG69743.1 lipase [Pseudomonas libanensis]WDG44703.1 alpha/beta hydrolase [Pseudomonas synxantha]